MLKGLLDSDYLRLGPLTSVAPFTAEQACLLEVGPGPKTCVRGSWGTAVL